MAATGVGRALRALTLRGRTVLIAGIILTVLTAVAGQRDIMAIGLILIAVPVVAMVVLRRARLRLSCERAVSPGEATVGSPIAGELTLVHRGRIPVGVVLLEDEVPEVLGQQPRFVVDEAGQDWQRQVRYPLTARYRGRFRTGPLRVRLCDPFGLVTIERMFTATSDLLVTPRVHRLDELNAAGGGGQTGDDRPHRIGVTGSDDVLVRDYRDGDDVRRIHWRSTAKRGQLMVRREEQSWDPSVTVLLDNRTGAHAGDALNGSFEWAVSAAASMGTHFLADGFNLEIYSAQGPLELAHASGQREGVRRVMMRGLAELPLRPQSSLQHSLNLMQTQAMGQIVVAVVGRLTPAETLGVARSRRNRAQGIVLLLDVDSFASARRSEATAEDTAAQERLQDVADLFAAEGWRVALVRAGTTVPEAWAAVGLVGAVR